MSKGFKVAVTLITIMLLLNVAYFAYDIGNQPWAPLCDYKVQKVLNTKGPDGISHVKTYEDVKVEAVKCNATDKPVKVRGFTSWYSKKPLGTSIQATSGANVREPGNETLLFDNEIPDSVVVRSRNIKAATGEDVVWILTGTETPYRDGGEDGVSETWVTEPFIIDT